MATGIYKRGNAYWIRYTGIDGKQKREAVGREKGYKDAQSKLADRQYVISLGKEPEIKHIPNYAFRKLAEQYKEWSKRQKSHRSKGFMIGQLTDKFGDLPLKRFTTMLVEQYQGERLARNKPATVNRLIATLSHMFTKAVEWEMVEPEIQKKIRAAKMLKENNKRLRYLSKEECRVLLEKCNEYLKPIVVTALNTGMRRGEILSLKWEQVDLKHGFILLSDTKNGERREIPINGTLREVLQNLPSQFLGGYVFGEIREIEREEQGRIVTTKVVVPYLEVKKSFHNALRHAKITDFRFHDLRHTFASHLVMSGVDITTVSRLLGHKSLTMTLRYSHLAPAHMVKAVEMLDSALNEKNTISTLLAQNG